LARALPRLEIASDHLQDAISAHENGDLVGADLSVLRLNGVLAGLFLSRGLGDGFGALVNALLSSLENLNGLPMSLDQIRACKRVIGVLRGEPYIDFSSATTQMDILEDVGLSIEPAGYEYIADWLDG
jgi:hypothetical protein